MNTQATIEPETQQEAPDSGVAIFTTRDLAQRYGVCETTILRWAQLGDLPVPDMLRTKPRKWYRETIERWERKQQGRR